MLGHGGRHRVVLLDQLLYLAGVGVERAGQLGQRAVELAEVVPLRRQELHRPRRRRDQLVEVRPLAVEIGGQIGHEAAHRVGVDGVERVLEFLRNSSVETGTAVWSCGMVAPEARKGPPV